MKKQNQLFSSLAAVISDIPMVLLRTTPCLLAPDWVKTASLTVCWLYQLIFLISSMHSIQARISCVYLTKHLSYIYNKFLQHFITFLKELEVWFGLVFFPN